MSEAEIRDVDPDWEAVVSVDNTDYYSINVEVIRLHREVTDHEQNERAPRIDVVAIDSGIPSSRTDRRWD